MNRPEMISNLADVRSQIRNVEANLAEMDLEPKPVPNPVTRMGPEGTQLHVYNDGSLHLIAPKYGWDVEMDCPDALADAIAQGSSSGEADHLREQLRLANEKFSALRNLIMVEEATG